MRFLSMILSFFMLIGSLLGIGGADMPAEESAPQTAAEAANVPVSAPAQGPSAWAGIADSILASGQTALADSVPAQTVTAGERALVPFSEMRYEHYDTGPFNADCEKLRALAEQGLSDEVNALYDRLYDEYVYADTLETLAMIGYDHDFNDEYWAKEYAYCYTLTTDLWDSITAAGRDVLDSPCADSFSDHVGRDTVWLFRYSAPTEEERRPRDERLLELYDEYKHLYETAESEAVCRYQGEEWDMDRLTGFSGTALASRDYDGYLQVLDELSRQISERFAPLYIELVGLRNEAARESGYDSYVDYAYEHVYYRDYSADDAQRFCDLVKPLAREFFGDLFYADIGYDADLAAPVFTGEELFTLLGRYLPELDPALAEPWESMQRRGLYDIAPDSDSGRFHGSYSTDLLYYHAPFLFVSLVDNCGDLISVTHEYGHCCNGWFNPYTNLLTQSDGMDLLEVHSNSMQALFTLFYDDIYTRGADIAEFTVLSDLLDSVFEGCLYDEFQRRVFSYDGELTAEKINELYVGVCREYGLDEDRSWDSDWCFVTHNFETPLYYISYAVSALPALQIWDMAQSDPAEAADTYLAVLEHGAWAEDYCDVIREAGLRLFSEESAASDICRPVLDRLEALADNY